MKKLLVLVALMAMVSTASFAQFKFGGGITLGSKMGLNDSGEEKMGIGINVRGDYSFSEKFSVAPGFTYFFPSAPEGFDLSAWQLNADAHYKFYEADAFSLYGIGGLNYSHMKTKFDMGDEMNDLMGAFGVDTEVSDNEIGIDLGAGINFGQFYGELKYDTAFEQLGISVGILF